MNAAERNYSQLDREALVASPLLIFLRGVIVYVSIWENGLIPIKIEFIIDNFWIDENFLRNMKLPQLQSFSLFSYFVKISFSDFSNIGLLYLAK
jgi:hypothetical protein